MRILRRVLLTITCLVAAMAVLLAAVAVAGSFKAGRIAIASLASSAVSYFGGIELTIDDPRRLHPLAIDLGRVRVGMAGSTVAVAEDVQLRIRAGDLLRLRFRLSLVRIGYLAVEALPPDGGGEGLALAPPWLPAEVIRLDRIDLAPGILGEAMVLAAATTERVTAAGAELSVRLDRLDRPGDGVVLHAVYRADVPSLSLNGSMVEAPGGPLGRRLGADSAAGIRVAIAGDGPLQGWRGHLSAAVDRLAETSAEMMLRDGKVDVSGRAVVDPGLLGDLAPLVGDAVTYRATLGWSAEDGVEIEQAVLKLPDGSLDLTGRVAADGREIALHGNAQLPLAPLTRLAGRPLGGTAGLLFHIAGRPAAPVIAIEASLTAPRFGGLATGSMLLRIDGRAGPDGRYRASLSGHATKIEGLPAALAPLAGPFDLAATIALSPEGGEIRVDGVQLTGAALSLAGDGLLRLAGGDSAGALRLVADLPKPAPDAPAGMPGGHFDIEMKAQGNVSAGTFRLVGVARGEGVDAGAAALNEVLGAGPSLTVTLIGRSGRPLTVAQAEAVLAAGSVTAGGEVDVAAGRLSLDVAASLPDLGRLSSLAGNPLAGRADVQAAVTGPVSDPAVKLRAKLAGLTLAGQRIDTLTLDADLRRLVSEPQGPIAIEAAVNGTRWAAAAQTHLRDGRLLDLGQLTATGPGFAASGDVSSNTGNGLTRGQVRIQARDAAPLAALAGLSGAGRADITLRLDDRDQRQRVEAAVDAQGLRIDDIAVDRLRGRIALDDALSTQRGEASLTAEGVTAVGAQLRQLDLSARGDRRAAAFDVALAGEAGGALTARATGTASVSGASWRVALQTLDARHGDIPVRLDAPTELRGDAGGFRLADTALSVERAKLSLAGGMEKGQVDGYLRAEAVPLSLARLVDPAFPLRGRLKIDASMRGAATAPRIEARLHSADLRARRIEQPLTLDLTLALTDGRMEARANIANLATEPLVAILRVPIRLSLQPWQWHVPPDGALSGRADGKLDLARTLPLLLPDGDAAAGIATLALAIDGTVAEPRVTGGLTLAGGRYENAMTEAAIVGLAVDVRGDGRSLRLSAQGGDGESGRISAEGMVMLADPEPALSGRLVLRDFWVARRADAEVRVSGDLELAGTLGAPKIAGKLAVLQAELRLPEELPPEVVTLDVVEINRPAGQATTERKLRPPSGDAALAIGLDIAVSADRRVFVRGRGLDSEWRGALRIRGSSNAPDVAGSLEAITGHLDFIGQRFVLAKGRLLLPGGPRINPDLDIVTELARGDLVAVVTVGGTMSTPALTLGARPDLPPEEVISRMLFDRGTARLSPLQAVQVAQSALALARGGSGGPGIIDRMRRATGLDVLDFEAGEGDDAAGAVSVGKYVTDNVLIRAEKGLDSTGPRAGVEVEVTRNISVESKVGGAATSVGVKIKKDY